MSKFIKSIRIIFAILVIIMSVFTFIALEGYSPLLGLNLGKAQTSFLAFSATDYGTYIIAIVSGLVVLGAVILLISTLMRASSRSSLILVDQDGKVVLTDDAIEAYALRSLRQFTSLKDPEVSCKILDGNNKKIIAKARAGVYRVHDLSGLSLEIKEKLRTDINNFIGKDIADVHITLDERNDRATDDIANDGSNSMSIQ